VLSFLVVPHLCGIVDQNADVPEVVVQDSTMRVGPCQWVIPKVLPLSLLRSLIRPHTTR
jgi:hypothetical protein